MADPAEKIEDVMDDIDDVTDVEDEDLIDDPSDDTLDDDAAVIDEDPAPPDDDAEPKPKKKGGVQRRIDKLTKDKKKAELDAAYWRGRAEEKKASNEGADLEPEPEPVVATSMLSRDDFESEDEYIDAKLDQRLKAKDIDASTKERVATINVQYDEAREKYDDFDEVALVNDGTVPITRAMFEAAEGDNLTEILYHLGKNPDIAVMISKMTPMKAAKEIAKLEVAIMPTKPTKTEPKAKPKQTTSAPEPAPTVKGGSADPVVVDPNKETQKQRMDRWDKEREARIKSGHGS